MANTLLFFTIAIKNNNMTQQELFNEGINVIKTFCDLNNIPYPQFLIGYCDGYSGYYTYKSKQIKVDIKCCRKPQLNPIRSWSFPGYFVDRTPYGVVCHEFGHYLHEYLGFPRMPRKGLAITNYEPDYEERFAETIKLFLTNSNLLKEYNPYRYNYLINKLKLKPIPSNSWEDTLNKFYNVNEKYINAAKNRIKNANKKLHKF